MVRRGRGTPPLSARPPRLRPPEEDDQYDGSDGTTNSVEVSNPEIARPQAVRDLIADHLTPAMEKAIQRPSSSTLQVPSSSNEARQPETTRSLVGSSPSSSQGTTNLPTPVRPASRTYAKIAHFSSIYVTQSSDFTLPFDPHAISKEEIELADEDVIEGRSQWENTLVGCVMGTEVSWKDMRKYVLLQNFLFRNG